MSRRGIRRISAASVSNVGYVESNANTGMIVTMIPARGVPSYRPTQTTSSKIAKAAATGFTIVMAPRLRAT